MSILVARVVHIELLPGVKARALEDVGQGVTQHAAPGVAHVHGTGGVGGDELHHDLLAPALVALAVLHALGLDVGEHVAVPLGAHEEVQEAGAGDLGPLKIAPLQVQMVHDGLGDGPGGHVHGLGPRHGEGGGIVAVLHILGDFDGGLYFHPGGQDTLGGGLLDRPPGSVRTPVPGPLESYWT